MADGWYGSRVGCGDRMGHIGQDLVSQRWLPLVLAGAVFCSVGQPWAGAQAGAFEEGVDFFQGGHYRWALEKFVEAVDRAPRDAQRRWYLGESYRQLGDNAAAAHVYRQILQMAPQSMQATASRRALEALGEPTVATVQVPFQKRGSSVLVPAKVNGQPIGYLILDTGATFTSLNRLVAERLGISGGGASVTLATASGLVQVPMVLLNELDIGGAVARYVPAVIHDLPSTPPNIVGLLGMSFLERFRVRLDSTSEVLTLETGE